MSSHTRATGSLRWGGVSHRTLMAWRLLSAIMLLSQHYLEYTCIMCLRITRNQMVLVSV